MLLQLEVGPAFGPDPAGPGRPGPGRDCPGPLGPPPTGSIRGSPGRPCSRAVAPVDAAVAAGQDQCGKRRQGLGRASPVIKLRMFIK
jgi:hypothetical protein